MALFSNYYLLIHGADGVPRTYLLPYASTLIGSAPNCDIFLDERAAIDSRHAQVDHIDAVFTLQDLGSADGTILAGENLKQTPRVPFPLRPDDSFQIGSYTLTFKAGALAQPRERFDSRTSLPTVQPTVQPIWSFYPYVGEIPPGLARYSLALLAYLPAIYQPTYPILPAHYALPDLADGSADTLLARFLALFESVLLPIEWVIENFDFYLDPRTAPLEFFPWLESWYGLPFTDTLNEGQRRLLLLHAHELFNLKGSRTALAKIIELYTGCVPSIDDLTTVGTTFRVEIKAAAGQKIDRDLVERLLVAFKPVHTTYELTII